MPSETEIRYDADKFSELMLYISHRCRDAEYSGAVKLAKMLYYCDFEAVRRLGFPITGETYVKEDRGPLPAHFYSTRNTLVKDQHARVEFIPIPHNDNKEARLVPTDDSVALTTLFDEDERAVIDETIDRLIGKNGTTLKEFSHKEFGWEHGQFGEPIPYSTALLPRTDNPVFADWLESR